MLRFWVDIYEFATNECFSVMVAGYINSSWSNNSIQIISRETHRDFNVRLGHDGTKCCVWVGETGSSWTYPQIVVRNLFVGYSAVQSLDYWGYGWNVDFATSFQTVKYTRSSNLLASDWNRIKNKPSTYPSSAHSHDDRYYKKSEVDEAIDEAAGGTNEQTNIIVAMGGY